MTSSKILQPLTAPLDSLVGLGEKAREALAKSVGNRVIDLLFATPSRLQANKIAPYIAAAALGEHQGVAVTVESVVPPRGYRKRSPWLVIGRDKNGDKLTLVFFKNPGNYLDKILPKGEERIVFGKPENFRGRTQMTHPDRILRREEVPGLPKFHPVYPHIANLYPKTRERRLRQALELMRQAAEGLDDWQQSPSMGWGDAVKSLHYPDSLPEWEQARRRLALDELLAEQLVLSRNLGKSGANKPLKGDGGLRRAALQKLDFSLTRDQKQATEEIAADLESERLMNRLLQGDVGSGKTIVALLAALQTIEAGRQAALMAPTDFLASQHLKTAEELTGGLGVNPVLLSSAGRGKKQTLGHIKNGAAKLIIGTHALFQAAVEFKNLSLVVIDEQQRFGVRQRLALGEKGANANILSLTATPIPRTLALTKYFGMTVSTLKTKPKNRVPTRSSLLPLARLEEVTAKLTEALKGGEQAFWICPSIQADEESALTNRFTALTDAMPKGWVVQAHGGMTLEEREQSLESFRSGGARLLAATTVVEVGIDIPTADIMVVENAERFGLAQLHQLRGRIGRGGGSGKFLGLYGGLSKLAEDRLRFFKSCDDGFSLAEKDLQLRSSGEILGTLQSGLPKRRFADFIRDGDLLESAHRQASEYLKAEPDRKTAIALSRLLELFDHKLSSEYLRLGG